MTTLCFRFKPTYYFKCKNAIPRETSRESTRTDDAISMLFL